MPKVFCMCVRVRACVQVCEERPRGHAAGLGSGKAEGPLPHPGARPLLPLPPGGHAHRLLQQPPRPGLGWVGAAHSLTVHTHRLRIGMLVLSSHDLSEVKLES